MDFGTESPEIVKLFKSDFGHEPEIWEKLEKATLTETIAARQGTSPTTTPSVAAPEKPTTPTPTTPNVGGLANRLRTAQVTQQHPAVVQAKSRINEQGIEVEDKMPRHYTPEMRAQAIHNVANGVEFMHQQFPGMSDLAKRENLKYTLQGPQKLQGGELMGMYHGNEDRPRIEINNAAEQTLWHEHAHFLDHASTGYDNVGTRTLGHGLRNLTVELQNHPVRKAQLEQEIAAAKGQRAAHMNHVMYRNQPEEVFARFFNSHMHYLHQKHGTGQTSEPYDPQYNEGWTAEHHEHFGPKLREVFRQHELTRSFGEYLDSLTKALEETRQGRPLPGTQRATRMPQGYKIPRKITRPGVRGSTLWWYDEKGNVRYGPRPVQRQPKQEEPEHVRNYLESEKSYAFVSAHSDDRSPDDNDRAHYQLGKELQSGGYQIYPSTGYYTDASGQLQEESSFLVLGLDSKSAIPLGRKYGQSTILTNHGMIDLTNSTLSPLAHKEVVSGALPPDAPQTIVHTSNNPVTIRVKTGHSVPISL